MVTHSRMAQNFVANLTRSEFESNVEKQLAVVRAIEVIGEAAKSVPEDIRALVPSIPWRQISGMRDKLIHHYFGVQLDTVWEVVTRDLDVLIPQLEELLAQLDMPSR